MNGILLLGTLAAVFAAALLTLPTLRVVQGRLSPAHAAGLWLSGFGFLLLALAAFVLPGELSRVAVLAGVACAIAGNILQRRIARRRIP